MFVLSNLPMYFMQTPLLPYGICDRIESYIRRFIWGSMSKMKKPHLIGWEQVCKVKEEGRLGIKRVRCMNEALSMKVAFNMMVKKDKM